MLYKIHSRGDRERATIYTTLDDVSSQMDDNGNTVEFKDKNGVTVVIPKERIIRILKIEEEDEE